MHGAGEDILQLAMGIGFATGVLVTTIVAVAWLHFTRKED